MDYSIRSINGASIDDIKDRSIIIDALVKHIPGEINEREVINLKNIIIVPCVTTFKIPGGSFFLMNHSLKITF